MRPRDPCGGYNTFGWAEEGHLRRGGKRRSVGCNGSTVKGEQNRCERITLKTPLLRGIHTYIHTDSQPDTRTHTDTYVHKQRNDNRPKKYTHSRKCLAGVCLGGEVKGRRGRREKGEEREGGRGSGVK